MFDSFGQEEGKDARRRLFCNQCGQRSIHKLLACFKGTWSDDFQLVNGAEDFALYQCGGCDAVCYVTSSWDSENLDHDHDGTLYSVKDERQYPPPLEKGFSFDKSYTPAGLDNLLSELNSGYLQGNYVASTFLLRVIVEYIATDAKCTGATLVSKINDLEKKGFVDPDQKALLQEIRKKANAGAHEGLAMSPSALQSSMEIISILVDKIYNQPGKISAAVKKAQKALK